MKLACLALVALSACTVYTQPPASQPAPGEAQPVASASAAPPAAPAAPAAPAPVASATPAAPAAPAADDADLPSEAPKEGKKMMAEGRSKAFKAGAGESFWVWQDAKGTHWHLRTTTKSATHRFHGNAIADADLKNVSSARPDASDRLKIKGAKRVSFDFSTEKQPDGIDFDVMDNSCVRFVLFIDGKKAETDRIKLGKDAQHPQDSNFKLCP